MPHITDRDVYASAMELVDAHRGRAIVFVERRWTEMEDAGDDAGLHYWRRVMMICSQCLDRRRLEFSGYDQCDGLDASPGFVSVIGTLLPIAPWGRSSL